MVIERQRERDGEHQENRDHNVVNITTYRHGNEIGEDDHGLRSNYIRQNRSDKKSFLAIE